MSLLNIYITKNFISKFIFLIIGFTLLFLIVDIIGNIDKFIESNFTRTEILSYCILSIPSFISIALPITTLLACIFTIGQLQKNHELTAIKASGISLKKISFILIFLGIIISFTSFIFDNTVVSNSMKKRAELTEKFSNKPNKAKKIRNSHIILEKKDGSFTNNILSIESYNPLNNKASGIIIQKINNNPEYSRLEFKIDIDSMIYKKNMEINNISQKNAWIRKGITLLNNKDEKQLLKIPNDTTFFYNQDKSHFTYKDLNKKLPDAKELSYWELQNLSKKRPDEISLKVDYNFKIAFSFTSLIMILFGIGLSIKKPRTNYTTGIGIGIIVIFLYYLGIKFGQSLGYSKTLSPFASVWIVNFIFLGSGIWLFSRIRT